MITRITKSAETKFNEIVKNLNEITSLCTNGDFDRIFVDDASDEIYFYVEFEGTFSKYCFDGWDSIREHNDSIEKLLMINDVSQSSVFFDWLRDDDYTPFDVEDIWNTEIPPIEIIHIKDDVEEIDVNSLANEVLDIIRERSIPKRIVNFIKEEPSFNIIRHDKSSDLIDFEYKGFTFSLYNVSQPDKLNLGRVVECEYDSYVLDTSIEERKICRNLPPKVNGFNESQLLAIELFKNAINNLKLNNISFKDISECRDDDFTSIK